MVAVGMGDEARLYFVPVKVVFLVVTKGVGVEID